VKEWLGNIELNLVLFKKLNLNLVSIKALVIHFKGFKYCRFRKSPILSELDKFKRLVWCLRYQNCDFKNYVFVDETAVRVGEKPLYHWRLPSTYPDTLPSTNKFVSKVNIWGGISYQGATPFAVNYL
jgi:hypothetical protein